MSVQIENPYASSYISDLTDILSGTVSKLSQIIVLILDRNFAYWPPPLWET